MLLLVKCSDVFAYFISAFVLHGERLECCGVHLLESFDVASVQVVDEVVYLMTVWTIVVSLEFYLGKCLRTLALEEVCKFVCYEQATVLSERVVVVHGVCDQTS